MTIDELNRCRDFCIWLEGFLQGVGMDLGAGFNAAKRSITPQEAGFIYMNVKQALGEYDRA